MKDVALIHLLSWGCDTEYVTIIPGITIYKIEGTPVEHLYLKECKKGLDSGDPFNFDVAIEIDYTKIEYTGSSFYSPIDEGMQIITVLSICLGTTFGLIRTIKYFEGDTNIHETNIISDYGEQRDFLIGRNIIFEEDIDIIRRIYSNVNKIWNREKANSHIINVLTYYFYARDFHFIEQTAINIAIILECLFHPHDQHELTHQIAYNSSLFLGGSAKNKKNNYKLIKSFYGIRSRIVHSGKNVTKDSDIDKIKEVFILTANILKTILGDPALIELFDNSEKRKNYLDNLLFS